MSLYFTKRGQRVHSRLTSLTTQAANYFAFPSTVPDSTADSLSPRRLKNTYWHFKESCCLHLQGKKDATQENLNIRYGTQSSPFIFHCFHSLAVSPSHFPPVPTAPPSGRLTLLLWRRRQQVPPQRRFFIWKTTRCHIPRKQSNLQLRVTKEECETNKQII